MANTVKVFKTNNTGEYGIRVVYLNEDGSATEAIKLYTEKARLDQDIKVCLTALKKFCSVTNDGRLVIRKEAK
jgi:hypothetical protein